MSILLEWKTAMRAYKCLIRNLQFTLWTGYKL
nr:MAG TPA: hypothetical protein [Caudoviricetes sp.]